MGLFDDDEDDEELTAEERRRKKRRNREDAILLGALTGSTVVATLLTGDPVGAILGDALDGSLDD